MYKKIIAYGFALTVLSTSATFALTKGQIDTAMGQSIRDSATTVQSAQDGHTARAFLEMNRALGGLRDIIADLATQLDRSGLIT